MLLQELLKNIILYKGIVKPIMQSWSDGLIVEYTNQLYLLGCLSILSSLNEAKMTSGMLGYEAKSLEISFENAIAESTGTRTISDFSTVSNTSQAGKFSLGKASFGNSLIAMLSNGQIDENAVKTGKTYLQTHPLLVIQLQSDSTKTISTTTGLLSNKLCFFLSRETHEKREYLGEFSLTHEETHLLVAFKEGGELS